MQLLTSATQIDYFPQGDGKHRFTKSSGTPMRNDQQMTSFSTVVKVEMKYQVRNYIANGAEVVKFNTEEYNGKDYILMMLMHTNYSLQGDDIIPYYSIQEWVDNWDELLQSC